MSSPALIPHPSPAVQGRAPLRINSAGPVRGGILLALLWTSALLPAQTQRAGQGDGPNYRLAARFAPYKIRKLLHSTSVSPRWIEGSERFWYQWETAEGKRYYLVDPEAGTKTEIFDNDKIAAELTRITLDPWDGKHLPIRSIKFKGADTLKFDVQSSQDEAKKEETEEEKQEKEKDQEDTDDEDKGGRKGKQKPKKKMFHFEYQVSTQTLRLLEGWEAPDDHPSWASVSPDGKTVVFVRHDNLYMISGEDYAKILDARRGLSGEKAEKIDKAEEKVEVEETQLTTDGVEHYSYSGRGGRGETDNKREKNKDKRKSASLLWAKDSRRFALVRSDRRKSKNLWVIHSVGNKRPELETYKYDMPGEKTVAQPEILIYDIEEGSMVEVKTDGWKDQRLSILSDRQFRYPDSEEPRRRLWLADTSDELYFGRQSRDQHRIDVMVADAATGEVHVVIKERLNTYVESQNLELLASGEMLWWSERDGWAHIYRYAADGKLENRITEGPWSVRRIVGIDEETETLYFVANGREAGEDPYYQHLYSVGLDGSRLQLLDRGDFDHRISIGESNRYFVDSYSRVNTKPISALFDRTGRKIMDLETADFSQLLAAGYKFPEPFGVKSADGITDIYGNIYRPFDFDPHKSYPIIAYVYPGPQTEAVSKFFSTNSNQTALAQFGFIVITVGNRGGNPARSKWYHNYGYGNLRDYGLADKKVAIEQLAARYAYIDLDRVGIYGHSGGGFMSTAAMLVYPDFFKVAVSESGNHDNNVYNANWSEKHNGIKEVVNNKGEVSFEYDIDKNSSLAANLKGHLLLVTGDIDNNVHPANTFRMADALIKANKRFDFFILPGQRHGYRSVAGYWFWIGSEYFVKHLLGGGPRSVDMIELDTEKEQSRGR